MAISPLEPKAEPQTPWAEIGHTGPAELLALPTRATRDLEAVGSLEVEQGKHRHPLAKLAYFAASEGPAATLRKVRAVIGERRMTARQKIVIASIDAGGRRYIGVTRRMGGPLRFDTRLVFRDESRRDPDEIELPVGLVRALESWLPVPSCPLDPSLPVRICDAVPGLRRVAADGSLRRVARRSAGAGEQIQDYRAIQRRRAVLEGDSVWLLGHGSYVRQAVAPWFRKRVAAALDYRAGLMRTELSQPYPVVTSEEAVLDGISKESRPLVIVSTYHSDHVALAEATLAANPDARVFLQKPAGVELDEIDRLLALRRRGHWIDVGYNRRHAPLAIELMRRAAELPRPLVATMTIKELKISPAHWYFWENQGTRITGNLSHWIDLAHAVVGRRLVEMTLTPSGDTVSLALSYEDGSLVTLVATDRGDDLRGVEDRIEVRGGSTTLTIDDFRSACWRSGRRVQRVRSIRREKGQGLMYRDLRRRWLSDEPPFYPDDALFWTGYATWHASRMLREGRRHHLVGHDHEHRAAATPRRLALLSPIEA